MNLYHCDINAYAMPRMRSGIFFYTLFCLSTPLTTSAQEQRPHDYFSIEPYGSYRYYQMENLSGDVKALPNYGAGIKFGRTIHRVHLELGLEYITKNYTEQNAYGNALGVHGGKVSANYQLDYFNIPLLIHVGLLPQVGGTQQLYISTGFLLNNARNFRETDQYADGFTDNRNLNFNPRLGGSARLGLRYDHELYKFLSLFAEAAVDVKFLKEFEEITPSSGSSINGNGNYKNLPNDLVSVVGNIGISFSLLKHPLDK